MDTKGQIVWSHQMGVWGEAGKITGTIENNLRFQGQYFDVESGLHYNRFRYYDPITASYISQDPIGLNGGINVHGYVHNPMTWIDPLGATGTYIFTDGIKSYIGKGPINRMKVSMKGRIGGFLNATQFAHLDFKSDQLGFMVEHKLMELYRAKDAVDFLNSSKINSPGKKLYEAADAKTKKQVDRLANKLKKIFTSCKK